jgi:hypothetical protein
MLRPKKGYENTEVTYRVGSNTFTIKVSDITPELMERVKHHTDLSYFVEEFNPITEYIPEIHDIETVIQNILNEEPKKKNTNKKKKP